MAFIALPTLFVPRIMTDKKLELKNRVHYRAMYRRSSPISAPFQRNWTPAAGCHGPLL